MTNVDDVNAFLAAERPCYRYYPEALAQAVLGMDPSGSQPQDPFTLAYHPGAGSGETDVTILFEDLEDDSVSAVRYVLTFGDEAVIGGSVGGHRLLAATRSLRCQPARGHQDWGPEPCL